MANGVATKAGARRAGFKFSLTHAQVMQLSTGVVPEVVGGGRIKLVPRPKDDLGKPYRIVDASQGAPVGFGFYVGKTKVTYEMVRRGPNGVRRFALGNVTDMGLAEAHEKAREQVAILLSTGENPKVHQAKAREAAQSIKQLAKITVRECMAAYLADMEERLAQGQVKANSVEAYRDSMARLARPEVAMADRVVKELREADIKTAYVAMRKSAMVRSNRIPTHMRAVLEDYKDWAELDTAKLESLGITGKYIQRVKAAGVAAAEHTFTDAYRGVKHILRKELELASIEGRPLVLSFNPFSVVFSKKLVRGARELRKHYERAEVRNPLDDNSLPKVLKAIVARRDEQGGHNAAASDYLLLTLLWGSRRSEAVQLRWFDRCSKGELSQREVSWVWLGAPDAVNPYTSRTGPQVFMSDTKSGESRFLPVTYFAERILRRRFEGRLDDTTAKKELAAARQLLESARKSGASKAVIAGLQEAVEKAELEVQRTKYVFPARSSRSKSGHYSDSKSILANVRRDAGLIDLRDEVDQGLTTHDLRRTLGRYAGLHLGDSRVVSQMLHHHVSQPDDKGMSDVSLRYTDQEWKRLREAFSEVEELMVASSPRVWNRLKGVDKPRLDESRDEPVTIFAPRNQITALDDD